MTAEQLAECMYCSGYRGRSSYCPDHGDEACARRELSARSARIKELEAEVYALREEIRNQDPSSRVVLSTEVAAEREACAKILDERAEHHALRSTQVSTKGPDWHRAAARSCRHYAATIRARAVP